MQMFFIFWGVGEIWAKIVRTPKDLPALTPMHEIAKLGQNYVFLALQQDSNLHSGAHIRFTLV